jgi:small-conductance mechanosensitive channel
VTWLDTLQPIAEAPLHSWLGLPAVAALLVGLLWALHRIGAPIVQRVTRPYPVLRVVTYFIEKPSLYALAMLALQFVFGEAPDELPFLRPLRHLGALALIASLTWLAVRCVAAVGEAVIQSHPLDTADNLHARRVHTQTRVLARAVEAIVVIIGIASMLMIFPNVRQVGASLLASAGVAGLVAGMAARPVLGNMIAGLQIALSQPLRLDDVVVIQGEWGRIEEITGTYVSVRLWDQRRLIVPLQWLIENPFQNWTRNSSQIIGSAFLFVDYRMPIAPLRDELARIVADAPEWDGRVQVLQVTDATEKSMQLRVLVSSLDSGLNWDLRCRVREGLLAFMTARYPDYLPRARAEVEAEFTPELGPGPAPKVPPVAVPPGAVAHPSAEPAASSTAANTEADPVASRGEATGPHSA